MKKIVLNYIKSDDNVVSFFIEQDKKSIKVIEKKKLLIDDIIDEIPFKSKQNNHRIDEFIVVFSSNYFMMRKLTFPFKGIENIKQAISLEMGSELPIKENNFIYDFLFLMKSKNNFKVLGIACKKTIIEPLYKKLSSTIPNSFYVCTLDIQCIISFLNSVYLNNVIFIYEDGDFLNLIVKNNKAFDYKKVYANLKSISSTNKKFAKIEYILETEFNQIQNHELINLIIIPSNNINSDLISKIKSKKQFKVIDPLKLMAFDIHFENNISFETDKDIIPLLGLCLKKQKDKIADFSKKGYVSLREVLYDRKFLPYLFSIVFVLIFVLIHLTTQIYLLKKYDNEITEKIERVFNKTFPKIQRKLTIEQYLSIFRGKIKDIESTSNENKNKLDPLIVLKDISRSMPDDLNLVIEEFSMNENRVILKGKANSLDIITEFRKNISKGTTYKFSLKQANWDKDKKNIHFIMEIS